MVAMNLQLHQDRRGKRVCRNCPLIPGHLRGNTIINSQLIFLFLIPQENRSRTRSVELPKAVTHLPTLQRYEKEVCSIQGTRRDQCFAELSIVNFL